MVTKAKEHRRRKAVGKPFQRRSSVRRDKATVRKLFPKHAINMMSEKSLHSIAASMRTSHFRKKIKRFKKK